MTDKIPSSWIYTKLENIVDIFDYERNPINNAERAQRISNKDPKELFSYYGATGQIGFIDDYRSEGERILLGEDAAPFLDPNKDKAYLVHGKYWVNNHAHILGGACNLVNNKFVLHQLNILDYREYVSGTTRLKLTSASMKQIPLVLAPYNEQIRIADKIDELFSELNNGIAELETAQKKLELYRQSLLKSAVEGELSKEWRETQTKVSETGEQLLARILKERRERWEQEKLKEFAEKGKSPPKDWQKKYPEPVQPDTDNLPQLPEGWVWATIDQLTIEQRYGTSAKTNDDQNGIPVLRMGNIQNGAIDFNNLKYLPKNHDEFPSLLLEKGDLLFNRTNSRELVGKTAIYNGEYIPCSYASYLIKVRFHSDFNSNLAAYYINSVFGKVWINDVAVQQTGQANVNGTKLSQLCIPVMSQAEQS
ncbi:restriction endonuclease subunit S, partial [Acinetobacter baumannii]|nr:restriction endonuclease subunit S [Acinetobacter baumannii]